MLYFVAGFVGFLVGAFVGAHWAARRAVKMVREADEALEVEQALKG